MVGWLTATRRTVSFQRLFPVGASIHFVSSEAIHVVCLSLRPAGFERFFADMAHGKTRKLRHALFRVRMISVLVRVVSPARNSADAGECNVGRLCGFLCNV